MRVVIGVAGRFHADRLCESFSRHGADARLISTFPRSRLRGNGLKGKSYLGPEIFYQIASSLGLPNLGDHLKMVWFGSRLKGYLQNFTPDIFVGWSSFSLEALKQRPARLHILIRDSTHIDFQYALLKEEYQRFGLTLSKRDFCRTREVKEYEIADRVWVLSEFAKRTFVESGMDPKKLTVIRLGVRPGNFLPPTEKSVRLCPLKVIYFGSLNLRKGVQYLLEATQNLRGVELTLIGSVEPSFENILKNYSHYRWLPPMPHAELARELGKYHIAVFPTLEDGFGQTLPEGLACGLVPIVTTSCGASELLTNRHWLVPPRDSQAIRHRLEMYLDNPDSILCERDLAIQSAGLYSWDNYDLTTRLVLESLNNPNT